MRRTTGEKLELIRLVEGSDLSVRQTLRELRLNGRPSTPGIAATRSGGERDLSRSPAPAGASGTAFPRGCASASSTPPWPIWA